MANTSIKLETSGQGSDLEGTKIQILGSPQAIPISISGTPNVSQQQLNVSGGNISGIAGGFKPEATSSPNISGIGQPQLIQTANGQILATTTGQQYIQQPNGMLQVVQAVSVNMDSISALL